MEISHRVPVLDELRGLLLLLMALYHAGYDLVHFYGLSLPLFSSGPMKFLVPFFAGGFILLSGACCRFSRSNLRRGWRCLSLGLALTAATLLFLPSQRILFGILHLLGCSMLLSGLLRLLWIRASLWWATLWAGLFLLCLFVPQGSFGIFGPLSLTLPARWYSRPGLGFLGFPSPGYFSADYFPLIPWALLFFAGVLGSRFLQERRGPDFFYRCHLPFLAALGRRSLLFYLLHQPLILLLLWLMRRP
ncbi:MAG: heparan-alpha-glucosaminide N-acetyltransferase domain-containing protein [Oscillospiraceae bacterium]|nr:heparan-alpha-glucosaminide N-acetyltransferase domain-containing protein [Oscillospiraceae bacterium]